MRCEFCNQEIIDDSDHCFECVPFIKKSFEDWKKLNGEIEILDLNIDNQATEGEENTNLDWELNELNKMSKNDRMVSWLLEKDKETGRKFRIHSLIYKIEEVFD